MSDLISRQAAIDAVEFGITYVKAINKSTGEVKELFKVGNKALNEAVERLKELPSAQPEILACGEGELNVQPDIVRCKDCKHWIPYDWMFSEVWQSKNMADYPEDEIGCNWCDMAMKANDFCSRGERREVTE